MQHYDKNGILLKCGVDVLFPNYYGKQKLGRVMSILPTCLKVFTTFEYYVDGKKVAGEGVFPVVPSDCEVMYAST